MGWGDIEGLDVLYQLSSHMHLKAALIGDVPRCVPLARPEHLQGLNMKLRFRFDLPRAELGTFEPCARSGDRLSVGQAERTWIDLPLLAALLAVAPQQPALPG